MILDKYPRAVEKPTVARSGTVGFSSAKAKSNTSVKNEEKVKPGQRHSATSEIKCTA